MKPPPPGVPRLLLVEDDPVSAAFLRDAAAGLPARVELASSLAQALACIGARSHDLLLIDANLPDGRGDALLAGVRERGIGTPALAHTADCDDATRQRLLEAGFLDVLCKPIALAALHAALRRWLPPAHGKLPTWDDDAALAALGGEAGHVQGLRTLFLAELPGQRARIEAAAGAGDADAIRAELHRLVASCGFVGAARLAAAVRQLQAGPLDPVALRQLVGAIDDLSMATPAG